VEFALLAVGITGLILEFFFKNQFLEEGHGRIGGAMFSAVIVQIKYQLCR
jgi:hypothetical protein